MSLNIFKHKETKTDSPVEEIKNTTEIEASPEEEVSPERIEALKDLENEIQEDLKLNEGNLVNSIEDVKNPEELTEKLTLLDNVAEIIKDHYPEIALAVVALSAAIFGFNHSTAEMAETAAMSMEKASVVLSSAITGFALVVSPLIWSYKNFNKKEASQTQEINNNSDEAIAA